MKILAFVDMHGSLSALKKIKETAKKEDVDFIISAGDHTIFGDSSKQLVNKLDKIGKPVLMLQGNHEELYSLKMQCDKTKNVLFMDKVILDVPGVTFVGHGGGGFALSDPDFEQWAKNNYNKINKKNKVVFLTHQPPAETKLANLAEGGEAGNKSYTKFIKKIKPVLVICGHLHYNKGMEDKIGQSLIVNPGPFGKVYEV